MIVDSGAEDIVYTSHVTGVHGNYLKPSIVSAGMDPDVLAEAAADPAKMDFSGAKAWKDIWGCGQGIGAVREICPAGDVVDRLCREYDAALADLVALNQSHRRAAGCATVVGA
jgi:nitronate monooxygenase